MITEELATLLKIIAVIAIIFLGLGTLLFATGTIVYFLEGRIMYLIWPIIIVFGVFTFLTSEFIGIQTIKGLAQGHCPDHLGHGTSKDLRGTGSFSFLTFKTNPLYSRSSWDRVDH